MSESVSRLCLALDEPTNFGQGVKIVCDLAGRIGVVKVNSMFIESHRSVVDIANDLGIGSWIDLKLHDIPRTVASGIKRVGRLGARFITIHLAGGAEMIKAALEAAGEFPDLKVLGITVLTSLDKQAMNDQLRIPGEILDQVLHLANLGKNNGIHGIVCSGQEVEQVRETLGPDILLITPGIRFAEGNVQDQKRVVTPGDAIRRGSNLLVMGSELIKGGVTAADRAVKEIEEALAA